ncbi:MAG: aminopeptidase [Spirochaetaceae bacterium]|nr:aminopeptidase [Spirochaetaceae bacterium]
MFANFTRFNEKLVAACKVTAGEVLKARAGETALIITNNSKDVHAIALCLYDELIALGVKVSLIVQPVKTILDMAEQAVTMAIRANPDIIISLSTEKMGKDSLALAKPYVVNGKEVTSHFSYLMEIKEARSFWAPGVTEEIFCTAVAINYERLKREAATIKDVLDKADKVHITSPAGMDITIGVKGRLATSDDGNFALAGSGGNLPAGETYISPEVASCEGTIVFDGCVAVQNGTLIIKDKPVVVKVEQGYVTTVTGGSEAEALLKTITDGEVLALEWEKSGKLPAGQGAEYKKNARHIGELGIGLNPAAKVIGNMLIDEKAYETCHFAIGSNYDDDANSLIHQDCVCLKPTITALMADGTKVAILIDGKLQL